MENNTDKSVRDQTAAVMRAAFKMPAAKEGRKKLQTHAAWLKADHADAAASLLEGIDEMFTVNDLGLTPALTRCLATTIWAGGRSDDRSGHLVCAGATAFALTTLLPTMQT